MTHFPGGLTNRALLHIDTAELARGTTEISKSAGIFFNRINIFLSTQLEPSVLDASRANVLKEKYGTEEHHGATRKHIKEVVHRVSDAWKKCFHGEELLRSIRADKYGFAVFSEENLKTHLLQLTTEALNQFFVQAEEDGLSYVAFYVLKNSDLLSKITPENLGKVFIFAIENGNETLALEIMKKPLFTQISSDQLGESLKRAISNGKNNIASIIVKGPLFSKISPANLGSMFEVMAAKGLDELVAYVLASSKFADVPSSFLSTAVKLALQENKHAIAEQIVAHPKFAQIEIDLLFDIFRDAALTGDYSVFSSIGNAIVHNPEFINLSQPAVLHLFRTATAINNQAILIAIMEHPRFLELETPQLKSLIEGAQKRGVPEEVISFIKEELEI